MINKILSGMVFFTAILLLLSIFSASWILLPMVEEELTEKIVYVPYGYNGTQIRKLLEKEKIIKPFNVPFQVMTQLLKIDQKMQSGEYRFQSSQNLLQVIKQMVEGRVVLYRITIPEGYQAKQIAQLLEDHEIASSDDFLQLSKEMKEYREGYLFPDTYEFPKHFGALNALELMRKNFNEIVYRQVHPDQQFPADLSFHEVIILASIIEKEAQGKEDKPKIASVFYNRLAGGMRLQSCATIQYLLEKPREKLTQVDLEIDSPFNTYLYPGLPPEPICNPGLDSILAAAYPADEEYLYFVLGKDGQHIFSKTYQEHLENKP